MKKTEIIFEEIILENTREINAGALLPTLKTTFPPRLSGLIATTPDLLTINDITLKKTQTL